MLATMQPRAEGVVGGGGDPFASPAADALHQSPRYTAQPDVFHHAHGRTFSSASIAAGRAPSSLECEYARRRIKQCSARHAVLTRRLRAIDGVEGRARENDERLYALRGKLSVRREALRELDTLSKQAFRAYQAMTGSFGKRALVKVSAGRARKVERSKDTWETVYGKERRCRDEVRELDEGVEQCLERQTRYTSEAKEFAELSEELEEMYDSIFGSAGIPDWPHEQAATSWHRINVETAQYVSSLFSCTGKVLVLTKAHTVTTSYQLAVEEAREKRAREKLQGAQKFAETIVKELQSSLEVCINNGIATNSKHKTQLFSNNSPIGTSKLITPKLLNAKTASGKLHTIVAETRAVQPLFHSLPVLEIVELFRMPGRTSERAISERELHESMMGSYAQARQCQGHLRRQLDISRERSKCFARARRELRAETEKSLAVQRSVRAEIVEHAVRGEAVVVPPLGEGEGGLSPNDVRRRAIEALRQTIKAIRLQTEGGSEDDELPGYEYIFGA